MARRKTRALQKPRSTLTHPRANMPWDLQPRQKIKMDSTCRSSHTGPCPAAEPRGRTSGKPAAPSNPTQGLPVCHSAPSSHSGPSACSSHSVPEPMGPRPIWLSPGAFVCCLQGEGLCALFPSSFQSSLEIVGGFKKIFLKKQRLREKGKDIRETKDQE